MPLGGGDAECLLVRVSGGGEPLPLAMHGYSPLSLHPRPPCPVISLLRSPPLSQGSVRLRAPTGRTALEAAAWGLVLTSLQEGSAVHGLLERVQGSAGTDVLAGAFHGKCQ